MALLIDHKAKGPEGKNNSLLSCLTWRLLWDRPVNDLVIPDYDGAIRVALSVGAKLEFLDKEFIMNPSLLEYIVKEHGYDKQDIFLDLIVAQPGGWEMISKLEIDPSKTHLSGYGLIDNPELAYKILSVIPDISHQKKDWEHVLHCLMSSFMEYPDKKKEMVIDLLMVIIDRGVSVNTMYSDNINLLNFAVRYNNKMLAQKVLDRGISITLCIQDRCVYDYLDFALKNDLPVMIEQLFNENILSHEIDFKDYQAAMTINSVNKYGHVTSVESFMALQKGGFTPEKIWKITDNCEILKIKGRATEFMKATGIDAATFWKGITDYRLKSYDSDINENVEDNIVTLLQHGLDPLSKIDYIYLVEWALKKDYDKLNSIFAKEKMVHSIERGDSKCKMPYLAHVIEQNKIEIVKNAMEAGADPKAVCCETTIKGWTKSEYRHLKKSGGKNMYGASAKDFKEMLKLL